MQQLVIEELALKMLALSLIHGRTAVHSSSRPPKNAVLCRIPPSPSRLKAPGLPKLRLSSLSKQTRGRCFIIASTPVASRGTYSVEIAREARREVFSSEVLYLEELVLALAQSTNFEEKVRSRMQSAPYGFDLTT